MPVNSDPFDKLLNEQIYRHCEESRNFFCALCGWEINGDQNRDNDGLCDECFDKEVEDERRRRDER